MEVETKTDKSSSSKVDKSDTCFKEVAKGFWNARGSFKILKVVDVGTHMSMLKLSSGKFVIIDAIQMTGKLLVEINAMTNNGSDIDAILATHPFHTIYMPALHKAFPKVPIYGTPRHVRKYTDIPWAGDLSDCSVRQLWDPEIQLRIPAGSEFINPQPENKNHFSCVFVYHTASSTLHVDDTICYAPPSGFTGGILKLVGYKEGYMSFHISMSGAGLKPYPEAPIEFRDWMRKVLSDWTIENICTAHVGNKIGGAGKMLDELVSSSEATFQKLKEKKRVEKEKGTSEKEKEKEKEKEEEGTDYTNEDGSCECG